MYHDKIFENALSEVKNEGYTALKNEIGAMETLIEKFLTKIFESTSGISERDFNLTSM